MVTDGEARDRPYKLQVAKCWRGQGQSLVWQGRLVGSKTLNKVFLHACADPVGITASLEKPFTQVQPSALIDLYRKHCRLASVLGIFQDPKLGHLWIELSHGYRIQITCDKSKEIRIIDPAGCAIVRQGNQGTFTKRWQVPEDEFAAAVDPSGLHLPIWDQILREKGAEQGVLEEDQRADPVVLSGGTSIGPEQRDLRRRLLRRLKTLRKAFAQQEVGLPQESRIETLVKEAEWLRQYGYRLTSEDPVLRLTSDETGGEPVEIFWDPDVSLGQQIDKRFVEAKRLRRGLEQKEKYMATLRNGIMALEQDIARLDFTHLTPPVMQQIASTHGLTTVSQSDTARKGEAERVSHLTFLPPSGVPIFVGRGSHDNDALTKGAKSHQTWLHVQNQGGAHIIIDHGRKLDPDPTTLRWAAILAIHYSKRRNDLAGEVVIAKRHDLKKRKGMAPGAWIIERGTTNFYRYDAEELKQILQGLQR